MLPRTFIDERSGFRFPSDIGVLHPWVEDEEGNDIWVCTWNRVPDSYLTKSMCHSCSVDKTDLPNGLQYLLTKYIDLAFVVYPARIQCPDDNEWIHVSALEIDSCNTRLHAMDACLEDFVAIQLPE